jgi:hypothetical protein
MEEPDGKKLSEVWFDMSITSKFKIIEDLVTMQKKFLSLSFTRLVRLITVQTRANN